jgi:hypothetical protein
MSRQTKEPPSYSHKGHLIRKTQFGRYITPGIVWGDQPGEHHSFRTLGAAKDFIDRNRS